MTDNLNKGHKAYERDFGGRWAMPAARAASLSDLSRYASSRQRCITIAGER